MGKGKREHFTQRPTHLAGGSLRIFDEMESFPRKKHSFEWKCFVEKKERDVLLNGNIFAASPLLE